MAYRATIYFISMWRSQGESYIRRNVQFALWFPSSKRRPHFWTCTHLGENKNLGQGSRGDLKPGMTMLARARNSFTDRLHSGSGSDQWWSEPSFRRGGSPIPKHVKSERNKNVVMGPETKNYCAGEGQQQFNGLDCSLVHWVRVSWE
jgi:hypothetical protein